MAVFQPVAFGKYHLLEKLAVGGMAEIFLAKSAADPNRYIVIKRILPHFSDNAQFVDMFIDEAKISAQLKHANIVPVHDLGKIGANYFLAMEWVPGQDLKGLLARCKELGLRLSAEHAAYISSEMLAGLDYAHAKVDPAGRPLHIVHRDVSPQNVLVGYDGSVKVTDFGIAKAESKLDATQAGTLKGKFGYMAPEQVVAGGPPLDHRADIFASGIILWELLTGHRLFTGTTEIEILEKVRAAKIEPPSSFAPDVPPALERIVFKALMKDRDKRYATAGDMRADLERFLSAQAPDFSRASLATAMAELFPNELEVVRRKWNVEVAVVDVDHAAEGARLEASRPDARQRIPTPPPMESPSAAARLGPPAANRLSPPPPAMPQVGRTPPPPAGGPPPPAPREPMRTVVSGSAPGSSPPNQSLVDELFGGVSPFEDTTSEADLSRTVATDTNTQPGVRRPTGTVLTGAAPDTDITDERVAERWDDATEQSGVARKAPARPERDTTSTNTAPRAKAAVKVATPARRGRGAVFGAMLFGAIAASVVALALNGVIPNPFAPPMIEVVATADAVVRIDGNVVLAAGKTGKWPVGAGSRVVEVSRAGYKPIVVTVEAKKGEVAFVDAVLEPLPDAVAEVPVETTPPGARVWLDAVEQGTTPLVVKAPLGDHTLRIGLPGHEEKVVALKATHPGESPKIAVELVPNIASIEITSTPRGASVYVGGEYRGRTPLLIAELVPKQQVLVTVSMPGYETVNRDVTPPGGADPFPVNVELVRAAGVPEKGPTPVPRISDLPATTATATPTPATSASARDAGSTSGFLTLKVLGGWGEVWVDGVKIADRTPVTRAAVAAGTRMVRVVNPVTRKEVTIDVSIVSGEENQQMISLE